MDYFFCCFLGSRSEPGQDAPTRAKSSQDYGESNGNALPSLTVWEHVRDAVNLWGDRGGGNCQPQPLFDAISAMMTLDSVSVSLCGVHEASVHMGSNAKVDHTLVPLVESEAQTQLAPPCTLSLSARTPTNEQALRQRLEKFLKGDIPIDPEMKGAIHVQDVDWADVDNGAAALSVANCLKKNGAKHKLHVFVSERRFTSEFSPCILHTDENGRPIKTEVTPDGKGGGVQFRVTTTDDLGAFEVKPSVIPFIKEMDFESRVHNKEDMQELSEFEIQTLKLQLTRAGLGDTVVGRSGVMEIAGLSGNVHKLTWYVYDKFGSVRKVDDFRKDTNEYFKCGIGKPAARREKFKKYLSECRRGPISKMPKPADMNEFFAYCRKHPQDKIVVHCGGPLFVVRALAQQPDLRERVVLIGAMFLSYDGVANMLGMNFNEGIARTLTQEVFGEDGKQIHRSFPNARVLCVTTETCKSPSFLFVPFKDTIVKDIDKTPRSSLRTEENLIPERRKDQPLMIISDIGKDPDDELACILLASLTRRGLAKVLGFIANLSPATERARLARGTLDELGLNDIPVAIGSDIIASNHFEYEFQAPYMGDLKHCREDGVKMFVEILERLEKGTMTTLVCLSGLTDAWQLLRDHRQLFRDKIGRVVIMGGVESEGNQVKLDKDGFMIPDKAQNNTFDFEAAQELYRNVQKESIPLTVVSRSAAYAAKLPFSLFDEMLVTKHSVGTRLHSSQAHSLQNLWMRACMPPDDPKREGLPSRCHKEWFCKVFLGGKGHDRNSADSIWDLASTFQAYDPIAVLGAVHGVRARYVRPLLVDVKGDFGVMQHEILGLNEEHNGIVKGSELGDWLHAALLGVMKV